MCWQAAGTRGGCAAGSRTDDGEEGTYEPPLVEEVKCWRGATGWLSKGNIYEVTLNPHIDSCQSARQIHQN